MRFKTNLGFHMEGRENGCEERGSIFFRWMVSHAVKNDFGTV
jgi:hypothetical protein